MRSLRNHFSEDATILNDVITTNSFNEEVHTLTPDPQLTNIPCYKEPISGGEVRTPGATLVTDRWNIILAGYYPQLSKEQAISVGEEVFNIIDFSVESTHTITAIVAEVAGVGTPDAS